MPIELRCFLEQAYEPRDLVLRYLQLAEEALRERGVILWLHREMESLVEVNERLREHGWFALLPLFDARCYRGAGPGYWIEGRAGSETVVTQAARLQYLLGSSLGAALRDLSFFYGRDGSPQPGEILAYSGTAADRLRGRVLYSGGTFARRDWRKKGVAELLPRLSRGLGLLLHQQDYTVSLVEPPLIERGVARRYGYRLVEPGIEYAGNPVQGRVSFSLCVLDRRELLDDLAEGLRLTEERLG